MRFTLTWLFAFSLLAYPLLLLGAPKENPRNLEPFTSPYFLDDVHCEGIQVQDVSEDFQIDQKEFEVAKRAEAKETCENFLRIYGVEKYMWITPDDLERSATLIRQADYFEDVFLSIKKSDLKNHIHLFLKVRPKTRMIKRISEDLLFYGKQGESSSRYYSRFQGEIRDPSYAPLSTHIYGIEVIGSKSPSAIQMPSSELSEKDRKHYLVKDFYSTEAYWKGQGMISQEYRYDLGVHLNSYYLSEVNSNPFALFLDGDFLYTKYIPAFRGNTYFGPAFIYSPYAVINSDNGFTYDSKIFPGIMVGYQYGLEYWNHARGWVSFYHSLQENSILDFWGSGQYYTFAKVFLIGGIKLRHVQNPTLPKDLFPLGGLRSSDFHIGLSKPFNNGKSRHQIGVVWGNEKLTYPLGAPVIHRETDYIGLKYRFFGEFWAVDLSTGYYFKRIF